MELSLTGALEILNGKVESWLKGLVIAFPNLIAAIAVCVVFWVLGKLAHAAVTRFLHRVAHNHPVARLMGSIVQVLTVVAGVSIALGILDLDKTVTSLLAGAGLAGLAIGFAFQEIAANFIAGVLIAFRKPFREGDLVRVNEHEGRITSIDLRTTRIYSYDGLEAIIPNKDMFTHAIINLTSTDPRRVDLEVGVSYSDDLKRVRDVVMAAVNGVDTRIESRPPEVFFTAFADSSINFQVRVWVTKSDQITYLKSRSEMIIRIKEAFDREGITIPFPIRALDLQQQGAEGKFSHGQISVRKEGA